MLLTMGWDCTSDAHEFRTLSALVHDLTLPLTQLVSHFTWPDVMSREISGIMQKASRHSYDIHRFKELLL